MYDIDTMSINITCEEGFLSASEDNIAESFEIGISTLAESRF